MYDIEPKQEIINEIRQELLADEVLSLTSVQYIIKKKEGITMYKNIPKGEKGAEKRKRDKTEKEKNDMVIRALRKARVFIRVIESWGLTHNLPYSTIKTHYTTENELEAIDKALKALKFHENDLPSTKDFDFELGHLRD